MKKKVDAVIIGGGLAGLCSAVTLKKAYRDASICILESLKIGSNNPSPLTFTDVIQKFGLNDCITGKYSEFCFSNDSGSSVTFNYSNNTPLVVIDYLDACAVLHKRLIEICGYDPVVKNKVLHFEQSENNVVLYTETGDLVEAKILIDCSGKAQIALSQLLPDCKRMYSHVYGAKFKNIRDCSSSRAYFLLPNPNFGSGGGWLYPLCSGAVSFGYASISQNPEYDKETYNKLLKNAVEKSELGIHYLQNAELIHYECGSIPVAYIPQCVFDRVVIVGDACGMATSWTCMGVEPTLVYGELAGDCAAEALQTDDIGRLNRLQSEWDLKNKKEYEEFAKIADMFWKGDFSFWEWVIRNDLRHLNAKKSLERMRWNKHLIGPKRALFRTVYSTMFSKVIPGYQKAKQFDRC